MAFDGFTMAALTKELSEQLVGGRLQKIAQPELDELLLTIKNGGTNHRLVLSVSASLPLIYLTENPKKSPFIAPNFCMLLRKHLNGAMITEISQLGMERVLKIGLANLNELGDVVNRSLMVEIMGKHSNLIFVDENGRIIDGVKRISSLVSSIREVLPGRKYFVPNTKQKHNLFELTTEQWMEDVVTQPVSVAKGLCEYFTGFSFTLAQEAAYRSGIDGDAPFASLNGNQIAALRSTLRTLSEHIKLGLFEPEIIFDGKKPLEFAAVPLTMYEGLEHRKLDSMSLTVETFYGERETLQRIHQKSTDIRKHILMLLERNRKKLVSQNKQLKATERRDRYRVYGELINTYGNQLKPGEKTLKCVNYYDNKRVRIPIDLRLTLSENANKYFKRYNKLKRTNEALTVQIRETEETLDHLETILTSLDIARQEDDLTLIRQELIDNGYMRGHKKDDRKNGKPLPKNKPLHYVSSDGYDIYVGKNNYQNDLLTFKTATGNDWWFHAKQIPGSHVVILCNNEEPPVTTFEEAASLAAYYSRNKDAEKVEIDYTQKKNIRKPNGSKPGFVVYYRNYSMVASPDISHITEIGQ
ncbi:MAG: NFACT family protein [Roseburia sp.]|nr:NFACT family protein [Roseburia sp.]